MNKAEMEALEKQLKRHEGFRSHAYQDSEGYWTIGIGRLVDESKGGGISENEAMFLLRNDILQVKDELDQNIEWWRRLSKVRRMALVNMGFNLGVPGLLQFENMLAALKEGNYKRAKDGALNSLWAEQVGRRAQDIAHMVEKDEMP
jgi:lysozyme